MKRWTIRDVRLNQCSRDDYHASIALACNVFILSGPVFKALRGGDTNLNTIPEQSWKITEESLRSTLQAEAVKRGQNDYTQEIGIEILKAGSRIQYDRIKEAKHEANSK